VEAIKAELEKAVPAMSVLLQKRQLKDQPQTPGDTAQDDVIDADFTKKD
jgi:hypothetical protein